MRLSCTVFEVRRVLCRNSPTSTYPTCIWRPRWGDPVQISKRFWHQNTRVPGLSCGVVCVMLRLAVLVEHRLVADTHSQRHRDRHTDRHRALAYTAQSIVRAVMNQCELYFALTGAFINVKSNAIPQNTEMRLLLLCFLLQTSVRIPELYGEGHLYRKWRGLSVVFDVIGTCRKCGVRLPERHSVRFAWFIFFQFVCDTRLPGIEVILLLLAVGIRVVFLFCFCWKFFLHDFLNSFTGSYTRNKILFVTTLRMMHFMTRRQVQDLFVVNVKILGCRCHGVSL